MPFRVLGGLLTTCRPLSHSTPSWPLRIRPAAQNLLASDAELESEPELPESEHFARSRSWSRRDILIVAGSGFRRWGRAKVPGTQLFAAGAGATGGGPFSPAGLVRTLNRSRSRSNVSRLGCLLAHSNIPAGLESSGNSARSWLPFDLLAKVLSRVLGALLTA